MKNPLLLASVLLVLGACSDKLAAQRASAARAFTARSDAAVQKRDWPTAITAAEQACAYDPLDPALRDRLHLAQLSEIAWALRPVAAERAAQLELVAQVLAERDAAHAHVYRTAQAVLALGKGDAAAAEGLLRKTTAEQPSFVPAQVALAQLLGRQGKADEALQAYGAALAADPENAAALSGKGGLLLARGDKVGAEPLLRKSVGVADSASARLALADLLWGGPKQEEVGEHLKRAVALEPNHGEAHRRLGEYLFTNGKVDEAAVEFQAASKLGAEPLASFGLALVLESRGNHLDAARLFEGVHNTDPRLAIAAFKAGLEFRKAGDPARASAVLARYLQSAGQDPAEQGRVAEAAAMLQQLATAAAPHPSK